MPVGLNPDLTGAAADDDAAAASLPAASRAALEEQRRHLELARYHMEMATSLHRAARAPPPAPQGSLLAVPPPPPARDDVTRALRDAARDFWLRDEPELPKSWSQTFSRAREPASPPPRGRRPGAIARRASRALTTCSYGRRSRA